MLISLSDATCTVMRYNKRYAAVTHWRITRRMPNVRRKFTKFLYVWCTLEERCAIVRGTLHTFGARRNSKVYALCTLQLQDFFMLHKKFHQGLAYVKRISVRYTHVIHTLQVSLRHVWGTLYTLQGRSTFL